MPTGGPPLDKLVLGAVRGGKVTVRLLDGYTGVLQADGFGEHKTVCQVSNLTGLSSWDHARRKLVESSKACKTRQKKTTPAKADVALGYILKLYYNLVKTAKANGLEPYAYILHILQHIANADSVEKLEAIISTFPQ